MGIDAHVLTTLLLRIWSIVAGGVMVFMIPLFLSPSEQGFYFTFSSILASQIFFELGFSYCITQIVSHECAYLHEQADGSWQGDKRHLERVHSLLILVRRWYRVVALCFLLGVGSFGLVFFGHSPASDSVRHWTVAWLIIVLSTSVYIAITPFQAITEGFGCVKEVAGLRLTQSMLGYPLAFIALSQHLGLLAITVPPVINALCSARWYQKSTARRMLSDPIPTGSAAIHWRTEILPFQWRIAVSWISGYFIFQLFNPLIFAYQSPVAAGQIGFSMAVFSSIVTLSMSWINAKVPEISRLRARREQLALNRLFGRIVAVSTAFNLSASLTFIAVVLVMQNLGVPLAARLADLPVLGLLALISLANHLIFALAAYMRAGKTEPMLANSVACGLFTLVAVWLGAQQGIFPTVLYYASITVFVALPWTVALFVTQRRLMVQDSEPLIKA
ncbi:MAG: hypothetical protein HYZ18_06030 [Pseudogulbenkiania sp.]|nr:hypothetical protein [Pseudogulbenkiania sp.]